MCGIAGILKKDSSVSDVANMLHRMCQTLRHRGPDDEGYVCFSGEDIHVCGGDDTPAGSREINLPYAAQKDIGAMPEDVFLGLAHRRLAVIDLSPAGHQPMCNASQSIWVVFNGEIYNYWQIREELEAKSVSFVSNTDVEVMLKAYEYWGMDFTARLNGMWSFVLYDRRSKCLIGCRDRYGVKPFYYYNSAQFFAFASEQKALLQLPLDTGINPEAVGDYLVNSRIEAGEQGLYNNIKELMPSHYLVCHLEDNTLEIKRYYTLQYNKNKEKFVPEEFNKAVQQVNEKLNRAITLRLRSDVNVGFCLSGGIDSSSIIGLSHQINASHKLRQLGSQLHAFTAVCDDPSVDESPWAALVAGKYGLSWHKQDCTADLLFEQLEDIIYYQDSPLFSASTYAQSAVMKLAREKGITILLDGQGGDELFAGYVPFYISYYLELLRRFRIKDFVTEIAGMRHAPLNYNVIARSMAKILVSGVFPKNLQYGLFKNTHKEIAFISPELTCREKDYMHSANGYSSNDLNTALFDFFTGGYLRNLLRWEDRCSMQYSVESRTPFADDIDLIEFVFSLPSAYKIHEGHSKYLLREAAGGLLPDAIYRRSDKLGFATPQSLWLRQSHQRMKQIISELSGLDSEKFGNASALLQNWDVIFGSKPNDRLMNFAWRYMNFLLWRKKNKM
ncbi:MAG TPA: asparagine synthase (glutamine-hydrolyzing) [Bacteroidales bacterium]|nr:asparagine synthase (glutamine-hydrolyzing) [Bacteroidales bacterium]